MSTILTYLDADVLIGASRSDPYDPELQKSAIAAVFDLRRRFAATPYLRLETLLKPAANGYPRQVRFLEQFFSRVAVWLDASPDLARRAEVRGRRLGLGGMDALHLEAAITLGVDEFITAERLTSPLFRETEITLSTIRPPRL